MKKLYIGMFTIFTMAILGSSMISAYDFGQGKHLNGMDLSEEELAEREIFRDTMNEFFENDDYEGWKESITSQLTEERFLKMKERHEKISEFKELREEIKEAWEDEDFEKVKELKEEISESLPDKEILRGKRNQNINQAGFFQRLMFWKN